MSEPKLVRDWKYEPDFANALRRQQDRAVYIAEQNRRCLEERERKRQERKLWLDDK